ncbi:MAG TPA: glycine cleavage system protein GcvH [Geminicoccus sp.]|jgi:glycine cleavage system H protein|uniref:glycine cleavage system protein GcvH n=1 Tax=Geminicoccus sp. TaxID=2024832 RepID=UPI002E307CA0|nr:glycine cleavage system protein GcvH [Geminicoccus sp.]HEX2528487.1 glycine cleavage system protein GcvH [Geminicoccus sp.]
MTTRYTKDHEWVRVEGDVATTGITDHAQEQLGDVVFVELPEVGRIVEKGGDMAVVESVKAASEVYAPISGKVVAINDAIVAEPGQVNLGAEGDAWFCRIEASNLSEIEELMTREAYDDFLKTLD